MTVPAVTVPAVTAAAAWVAAAWVATPWVAAAWVAASSLAGLGLMASDKRRAVRGRRRVPERTLLTVAAAGGSPGVLAGMLLWRHKTRKPAFALGVPLLLGAQAWAAGAWLGWW